MAGTRASLVRIDFAHRGSPYRAEASPSSMDAPPENERNVARASRSPAGGRRTSAVSETTSAIITSSATRPSLSMLDVYAIVGLAVELVPHAPHGLDVAGLDGVDLHLLAQPPDVHGHRAGVSRVCVVPRLVHELFAGEYMAGV